MIVVNNVLILDAQRQFDTFLRGIQMVHLGAVGIVQFDQALLHKDLKVKTSHIYSNLSDNSGMWSA